MTEPRLNEFTKEEWWDVMRKAKPEITREEFDQCWQEFCELKKRKHLQ